MCQTWAMWFPCSISPPTSTRQWVVAKRKDLKPDEKAQVQILAPELKTVRHWTNYLTSVCSLSFLLKGKEEACPSWKAELGIKLIPLYYCCCQLFLVLFQRGDNLVTPYGLAGGMYQWVALPALACTYLCPAKSYCICTVYHAGSIASQGLGWESSSCTAQHIWLEPQFFHVICESSEKFYLHVYAASSSLKLA